MSKPALGRVQLSRRGLLVATAGTLFTAACGSDDERNSPGPTTRGSEELIIGASLELTGPGSAHGVLQERALRITVDTLNEEGVPVGNLRRRVKMIYRDNASQPDTAAQQVTELIQKENVHALLGGVLAETSQAMLKVAQTEQVPFISLASADGIVTPLAQRTYIYKLQPNASDVAQAMADLRRNFPDTVKADRIGVVYANGAYGAAGIAALRKAFGSAIVAESQLPRTFSNASTAVRKVTNANPDVIIIWAQAPDSAAAAQAAKDADFEGTLILDPGAVADDTLTSENASAVDGAYAIHPASLAGTSLTDTTMADLDRRDFIYRYIQKHGAFRGFAPYTSDAVRLIANAARLGRSVDRGRIRVYLENLITEGIAGSYDFQPLSHGGMTADSLAVFQVIDQAWVRYS